MHEDKEQAKNLQEIADCLRDLRTAIKTNSPLLHLVASSRLYPILGLVFGVLTSGYSIMMHILTTASDSAKTEFQPARLTWIFFVFLLVCGAVVKVFYTNRFIRNLKNASFRVLLKTIYGGRISGFLLSAMLTIAVAIVFLIRSNHLWYIVPVAAIFTSFVVQVMNLLIELAEYSIFGFSMLIFGLTSLFVIETWPWLCVALTFGGSFLVFGIAGLIRAAGMTGKK